MGAARAQFNEVQSAEIPQIAAACAELGESAGETYAPLITFSAPSLAPACAKTLVFWCCARVFLGVSVPPSIL